MYKATITSCGDYFSLTLFRYANDFNPQDRYVLFIDIDATSNKFHGTCTAGKKEKIAGGVYMGPYGFVDSYEYIAGSCCPCLQVKAAGTFATFAYINQTVRHQNGEEWCCGTALISC